MSPSLVHILPLIPLPFHHHSPSSSSVSSFSSSLSRPASGSPQRRDLRHFTCVSFASDPVPHLLLLLFLFLPLLLHLATLLPSRHTLTPDSFPLFSPRPLFSPLFHENCSSPFLFPLTFAIVSVIARDNDRYRFKYAHVCTRAN